MTERDRFALAAMQAFVSGLFGGRAGNEVEHIKYADIALFAYALADAMLKRREEKP